MTQNKFKVWLGFGIIIACIIALILLYFFPIPEVNAKVFYMAIGVVLGWGGSIVNYHWGSSEGSKQKDQIIKDIHNDKKPTS